jgi:hypothetical protein
MEFPLDPVSRLVGDAMKAMDFLIFVMAVLVLAVERYNTFVSQLGDLRGCGGVR